MVCWAKICYAGKEHSFSMKKSSLFVAFVVGCVVFGGMGFSARAASLVPGDLIKGANDAYTMFGTSN